MAKVILGDQNTAKIASCPYCERMYDITAVRRDGDRQISYHNESKIPQDCERCGCPMDLAKVDDYANKMAVLQNGSRAQKEAILRADAKGRDQKLVEA